MNTPNKAAKTKAALLRLSKASDGRFRAIAYAVIGETGDEVERRLRLSLRALLQKEHLDEHDPIIVVELADPFVPASERSAFRNQVVVRIESGGARQKGGAGAFVGRSAPARSRERLADLSEQWTAVKDEVDATLASYDSPRELAAEEGKTDRHEEIESPASSIPQAPAVAEPSWLVLVRKYEDLGAGAGAITDVLSVLITHGAHVLISEDGLDTRRREGRLALEHVLRVGQIRAERARERSMTDLDRRRAELRVYGHVPFGFRRENDRLIPNHEELAIVKRIRELAGQSLTHATIAATLNGKKLFWREGKPWTRLAIARVLKNPIYDHFAQERV